MADNQNPDPIDPAGSERRLPEAEPGWERAALERIALAAITEQRAARRWKIFFRFVFLGVLALLVWGVAGAVTRWRAGALADRSGLARLLPSSAAVAAIGLGIVVAGLLLAGGASWAVTLIGSAVLGAGYGAAQNLTLLASFARARQRETATVSSIWNVGFDTGTAVGAALVGAMSAAIEVPASIGVTAVMVAAVVIAVGLMLVAADPLARFIGRNPTVVMLALGILLMIGAMLIADGFGIHVPRGYVYAAMGFSAGVEALNMAARRRRGGAGH